MKPISTQARRLIFLVVCVAVVRLPLLAIRVLKQGRREQLVTVTARIADIYITLRGLLTRQDIAGKQVWMPQKLLVLCWPL